MKRLAVFLLPTVALAIGVCIYKVPAVRPGGFPLDDAWIHLSLARNLWASGLFAVNPGEAVGASTAPLWTILLAPFASGATISVVLYAKLLGLILTWIGVEATRRLYLAYQPGAHWAAAAAGCVAALLPSTLWGLMSGLEVSLAFALTALALWLHAKRPANVGVPFLIGLATAARPEALVLWPLAIACRGRRVTVGGILTGAAALALPLAPMVVANLSMHGAPLPTTFYAKIHQSRHVLGGQGFFWALTTGHVAELAALFYHWSLRHLAMYGQLLLNVSPFLVFAVGAGVATGARRAPLRLAAAAVIALPLAIGIVTPRPDYGAGGRYIAFLNPAVAVLAVAGLAPVLRRVARGRRGPLLAALLLAVLFGAGTRALLDDARHYRHAVANTRDMHVAMANWIAANTPPNATIAVHDIGAMSYFGGRRLVDLEGIATPAFLDAKKDDRTRFRALAKARPDYLVIAPNWYPDLAQRTDVFEAIHVIRVPPATNRVLAGPVMVVFRARW